MNKLWSDQSERDALAARKRKQEMQRLVAAAVAISQVEDQLVTERRGRMSIPAAVAINSVEAQLAAERRRDIGILPLAELALPIRANTPRAGERDWEWESRAPDGRVGLAVCVIVVCGVVLTGLVIAGLRWRAGITW